MDGITNIKNKLIFISISSFLFGIVISGFVVCYLSIWFTSGFFADGSMLIQAVDTQKYIQVLNHLRKGKTDISIELLESELNNKLISLDYNDEFTERTNDSVVKALYEAKKYREIYSREVNLSEIDKMANDMLNNLTKKISGIK